MIDSAVQCSTIQYDLTSDTVLRPAGVASSSAGTMWNDLDRQSSNGVNDVATFGDVDGGQLPAKRSRTLLDCQSHRVIEKRRRDRINSCLADLGRLVATDCTHGQGQGQARIKKTEIIEMAIQRIRQLQSDLLASERRYEERLTAGFKECRDVTIRFLVDYHGADSVGPLCTSLLRHLHQHLQSISVTGNRTRTGYRDLYTATSAVMAAAAAANATSVAETAVTMNGSTCSWPNDLYIKPEMQTPPRSSARPDVVSSQLTDLTTMTTTSGGNGVSDACEIVDERKTGVGETTDDVTSRWNTMPSLVRITEADGGSGSGYKYKDNIKRRFCSEGDSQGEPGQTRSESSSSDGALSAQDCCSPSSSPEAPPPPKTMPTATVRNNCAPTPTTCCCRRIVPEAAGEKSPGFVLHPSGAYYVPVMAAKAQVRTLLGASATASSGQQQGGDAVVCHPVSIPVRFTGSALAADLSCVNDVASTAEHHHHPVTCQSLLQLQRL